MFAFVTSDSSSMLIIGAGQSGLAAAHTALQVGLRPLILEGSGRATGSWPHYYDSLTLFSPARYSALPGMAFPGDPDRYPHRDEVISYLESYAADLIRRGAEIRTGNPVVKVNSADGVGFVVHQVDGQVLTTPRLIAATGSFAHPHRPVLAGQETFTGQILHAAAYRNPEALIDARVVVVGAGNSAVQIAYELADYANVTLVSRAPVRFVPQRPMGGDLHFWFRLTRFDRLPLCRADRPPAQPVLDDGRYRQALRSGRLECRPMFTRLDGEHAEWADGHRKRVDVVLLATGYRPNLDYLAPLDVLDAGGRPRQARGLSSTHLGLGYLGLEWQRTPASNSLRGVGADARYVVTRLLPERQMRWRRTCLPR